MVVDKVTDSIKTCQMMSFHNYADFVTVKTQQQERTFSIRSLKMPDLPQHSMLLSVKIRALLFFLLTLVTI